MSVTDETYESLSAKSKDVEAQFQQSNQRLQTLLGAPGTPRYEANSNISFAGYAYIVTNVTEQGHKKNYSAHGGGVGNPGIGVWGGHVYTDDIERLYRDTISCQFNTTAFYCSIVYFDGNSNALGTFQGGGIGTSGATGGGSGRWSG